MNENIYEQYLEWFTEQGFYLDYLINLPEPLNNPTFASAVVLVAGVMVASSVIGSIKSWAFHRKIVKKNRELEELRANQRLEDAKREQERKLQREAERDADRNMMRDMMSQYQEFMAMVHAQNAMGQMMSLKNMTFDQWQMQMYKQQANEVIQTPSQKELDVKYNTDIVTGLLNRNAYERDVQEVDIRKLGIVSIDANNLKKLNDSEGHDAGDMLLRSIAEAIVSVWGKERSYRTGGDEFTVITEGVKEKVTRKNMETFRELVSDDGCSAAVGYADAFSVKGKPSLEKIQKASDQAMYMDKNSYKKAIEDKQAEMQKKEQEEEQRRAEEEAKAKAEEEARLEAEKIAIAKAEAERKARELAEEQARIEAEKKAESEKAAREEAERIARAEAEEKAKREAFEKAEAERLAKEEAERLAKEAAERAAREEAERAERERVEAEKTAELARIEAEKAAEADRIQKEFEAERQRRDELANSLDESPVSDKEDEYAFDGELPAYFDSKGAEDESEEEIAEEKPVFTAPVPDEIEEDDSALTDEQQSDFAKMVAMMAMSSKKSEQLDDYNQKKSEIVKRNIEALDGQIAGGVSDGKSGSSKKKTSEDDELEKQKKEALQRKEALEKAEAEKGQKKKGFGLFKKK